MTEVAASAVTAPAAAAGAAERDVTAVRTARWCAAMFLLLVLLQRLAVPGLPASILVPVLFAWVGLGLLFGVLEFDRNRLVLWCAAELLTGAAILVQLVVLPSPIVSLTSWLLFTFVWLPVVTRFVDRRISTYQLALRYVVGICGGLAVLCILMMASQLVGLTYRDFFAEVVPLPLQLDGFALAYPLEFGSNIYKANAWIGLEPSIVCFQLGLGLLAVILLGMRWRWLLLILAGMVCTATGSGFFLVGVALVAMLFTPARRRLARVALPIGLPALVLVLTSFGKSMLERANEVSSSGSSASLRVVEGYHVLWSTWSSDVGVSFLGRGVGSSQRLIINTGIPGLLVPTPAKIFYDYGLVAGGLFAVFLIFCYFEGPSLSLAFGTFVSLWVIQSGEQAVYVVPVVILVTLWAPRPESPIEDEHRRRRRMSAAARDARATCDPTGRPEPSAVEQPARG